ncbi:quinone-dependent dihydroorotate dehydrogenase [Sphingomonas sp. SUN039]|uniref:quinone-dependent dihydroorotate dehydrogenase n=1 Tax=Sphingomonas sp. SUN039 TaxID=2937787 RepID=UPI0021640B56|nr:quinone-dependent dihydroorotate dehydrogenase [Sphingomonas sp. SUN039]UVO54712.1 quinone-dependent dihydroorotate dehydrogenase [Sphingomonas sp. SUN039]
MSLFDLARPALFRLDPERAHGMTLAALKVAPWRTVRHDPVLATQVAGLDFPSPVGLAAGFDKDAEVPDAMLGLGFGFVEVGTLTPLPQEGNPRPRLFRLEEDEAVINRMGFNNRGQTAALERLERRKRRKRRGVVGINIGANKDAVDRIGDYVAGVRAMAGVADYLTVNISSPNTPGLRGLQDLGPLTELLTAIGDVRVAGGPPLFLKVAPDLTDGDIDGIVKAASGRVDALVVSNTTIMRFENLRSPHKSEAGGLSGKPLRGHAYERLRDFRRATGGTIPLIGVGGIDCAEEAYARIRSGAALVQLYSALVYRGPGLAREIADGLARQLKHDGFASVAEAVGVDAV